MLLLAAVAAVVVAACSSEVSTTTTTTAPPTTTTAVATETTAAVPLVVPQTYEEFREQPTACGADAPAPVTAMQFQAPEDLGLDPDIPITASIATSCGTIEVELDPSIAPETVNSFAFLAEEGYFDGSASHRILPGFVLQAGDQTATGLGGPGYTIADEFPPSDFTYTRGTLAMANAGPGTTGSQFFILFDDNPLPPQFSVFGEVVGGFARLVRQGDRKSELVDVNGVVGEVLELAQKDLDRMGIAVSVEPDPGNPRVRGDPVLVAVIVFNLIRNAIEAMSSGEAAERSLTLATRGGDRGVEVVVTDRGPGIPETDRERVFDPFFTTREGGSGLGLAVSRTLAELYGGRIVATAGPDGRGTSMRLSLPSA